MRQIFSSARLESVEQVAAMLGDAGIEHKISEGRSYKGHSRREFSYIEKTVTASNQPAVWVLKPEDYKRARELLHGLGLLENAPTSSYVPGPLQLRETARVDPQKKLMRIKLGLLLAIGTMVGLMVLRVLLT